MRYPDCGMFCLDFMRQSIKKSTAGSIAAIIVEPIQGTAGNVVPPPEFLPGVKDIAQEVGALLIVDEIITGFGRTGKMFAHEHAGVVPDIMTIGKGMGGGLSRERSGLDAGDYVGDTVFQAEFLVVKLWRQPPLAATAALATIQTIVRDKLVEHTAHGWRLDARRSARLAREVRVYRRCARQGPPDWSGSRERPRDQGRAVVAGHGTHLPGSVKARAVDDGLLSPCTPQSAPGDHG